MTVDGVHEPDNTIQNEEHDHTATAKRIILVDASGNIIKLVRTRENILGAAGTGVNPNKVFTLTTTNDVDIVEVYVSGTLLLETTQYTIDNTAKTVTMVATHVAAGATVTIFYNR